jgi:hypothetical protein
MKKSHSPIELVVKDACGLAAAVSVLACMAAAKAEERGWILEIGPAAEWPLQGDTPNYGANIAVERELIDGWLEIELGMSALYADSGGSRPPIPI